MIKIFLLSFSILFIIMLVLPITSATPFIVGRVNDSLDGVSANGKTMVLWNPNVGINDNVTDIIGTTGNSGTDNLYLIDCDLLASGCTVGMNISLKVVGSGGRVTNHTNLTINGAGFQSADDLALNSLPLVNISSPINYANHTNPVSFYCNATDLDGNLANVTLYGNWSNWHANETVSASTLHSSNNTFSKNISDGRYVWACMASDTLGGFFYSSNYTLTVDNTGPLVTSVVINLTAPICGTNSYVRVNCTVADQLTEVQSVYIRSYNKYGFIDYPSSLLSGNVYYSDLPLNYTGNWTFGCFSNDTLGNVGNLNSSIVRVYSNNADLTITSQNILFTPDNPIEGQNVLVNTTIMNNGCSNANNFLVSFYEGDPDFGGLQIGNNQTISINSLSNGSASTNWIALIGNTNIFTRADLTNLVSEENETDNTANVTKFVTSWQTFYGNATIDKLLGNNFTINISVWINQSVLTGNIFVADTESIISWDDLIPLGKNFSLSNTTNDFADIDYLLNMSEFNDSISNRYTTNGINYRNNSNFLVYQRLIQTVPIIYTSNTYSFMTGLLWDSSDDNNGEFDQVDKEDLVFVSKINNSKQGSYGTYDYEIDIPARLRSYSNVDDQLVYFYFDLN